MSEGQTANITQEELLKALRVRDFDKGGFESPVKSFVGRLDAIIPKIVTFENSKNPNRTAAVLNFSDLQIVQTDEPWNTPVLPLEFIISNRDSSKWAVLGTSIGKLIPPSVGMEYCIGKYMHLQVTPGHMLYDGKEKKEMPQDAWECLRIDAVKFIVPTGAVVQQPQMASIPAPAMAAAAPAAPAAPSANAPAAAQPSALRKALEILEGKTEKQWNIDVFNDPIVRTDKKVVDDILNRAFLNTIYATGAIQMTPDGIWHVDWSKLKV